MELVLKIKFPDDLNYKFLITQKYIPCLCKVKGGLSFEIEFMNPLPAVTGVVEGWTAELICDRAPAGAGGEYTHYNFSLVSINNIEADKYQITSLMMFYEITGWYSVVEDGMWSTPALNTPEELAELAAISFRQRRKKKR